MSILRFPALALLTLLIGCQTTVETHGHRLDENDLARIRPGSSSRGDVAALLGTPSTLASFDARTWYYVGRRVEEQSFFDRDLTAQDVVRVRFDELGVVEDVQRYALADAREIDPVDDETPTGGNELNVVEQFIGNIGRFNVPRETQPF